jgi:hypothetical protein
VKLVDWSSKTKENTSRLTCNESCFAVSLGLGLDAKFESSRATVWKETLHAACCTIGVWVPSRRLSFAWQELACRPKRSMYPIIGSRSTQPLLDSTMSFLPSCGLLFCSSTPSKSCAVLQEITVCANSENSGDGLNLIWQPMGQVAEL